MRTPTGPPFRQIGYGCYANIYLGHFTQRTSILSCYELYIKRHTCGLAKGAVAQSNCHLTFYTIQLRSYFWLCSQNLKQAGSNIFNPCSMKSGPIYRMSAKFGSLPRMDQWQQAKTLPIDLNLVNSTVGFFSPAVAPQRVH